jgi:hypothetical protein
VLGSRLGLKGLKLIKVGLAAVTGGIALLVGVVALKWYLWDIVIQQAAESDRSMLFWGIPIAMIGVVATAAGVALLRYSRRKHSAKSQE